MTAWEIGPVKLVNGTVGHIDFVHPEGKSIRYTGRFKAESGDWWALHWNEFGRVPNSCEGYGHNLCLPPKKTVRVERYVNVYEDGTMVSWATREEADGCVEEDRFACIEIDRIVTEGEGL